MSQKIWTNDDDINRADSDDENSIDSEDENDKLTFHCFLKDHPLYHSHHVTLLDDIQGWVPNFVGGAIPRSDCGDREYYCATMLTFFKPWRTGKDLKTENYSWDETFNDHQFTPRQLELMQFFNIRYECNDARDDFSTQLKKGDTLEGVPQWM